ncbi:hypothetical protein UA08_08218 [Talaromyces atroroseus]|uniref:GPI anchored cell wall protein n=1 Tax=Talaromyces atroroseus TaxID=1441469 RepID=A0A225AF07_TALAT|nr:hypothetical protein UA08_08218 [Talaromyces atroroseus]OKL56624.1 hypothetical protein UA08_08218 [Talaromyces atroroseus]
MHTAATFTAAAAAFLAMTVAGQTTSSDSTTQSLSTTAAPSASSGSTYIALFEAGYSTTLNASNLAGSIISANADATTIALNCIEINSECNGETITLTQGPSTWVVDYSTQLSKNNVEVTLTLDTDCNIVSSTAAATCTVTEIARVSADGESSASTFSTTETFASSQIYYDQLLITAGVDKLTSPQATKTPSSAAGVVAAPLPTGNVGMGVGGMAAAAMVAVAGML